MTYEFSTTVLQPLVDRYQQGAAESELRSELLTAVLPWVRQQVARNVRRIPSNADAANVSSLMHEAAYLAVQRLDWTLWRQWPMYLGTLVRRAGQEAARRDDYLSRQQRVLRTQFRTRCLDEEFRTGTTISHDERRQIATELADGRHDLVDFLLIGWHPHEVAEMPEGISDSSVEDDVERRVTRQRVQEWLAHDLPDHVQEMVQVWLQTPRSTTLPRRLEHHLRPHVGRLLAAIDDHHDETDRRVPA